MKLKGFLSERLCRQCCRFVVLMILLFFVDLRPGGELNESPELLYCSQSNGKFFFTRNFSFMIVSGALVGEQLPKRHLQHIRPHNRQELVPHSLVVTDETPDENDPEKDIDYLLKGIVYDGPNDSELDEKEQDKAHGERKKVDDQLIPSVMRPQNGPIIEQPDTESIEKDENKSSSGKSLGGLFNGFFKEKNKGMQPKMNVHTRENESQRNFGKFEADDLLKKYAANEKKLTDAERLSMDDFRKKVKLDEVKRKQEALSVKDLYSRATKVSPALNYLGIGYDSIKGNPLGDPSVMADPGLRGPILQFRFSQDVDGVTSDLSSLQPLGAFTRPFVACRQSETVTEVSSLSDYMKELSVDAQVSAGDSLGVNSFSASVAFKEMAKEISNKENKAYMLKTYCLRYEAGLSQTETFDWNYTLVYNEAVENMPDNFGGGAQTACTVNDWRTDPYSEGCAKDDVSKWMEFFEQFGTHVIVHLFAGGKMTHRVTMSASDIRSLQTKGIDSQAAVKAVLGVGSGSASNSTNFKENQETAIKSLHVNKETLVMGGQVPQDVTNPQSMAEWSDSVADLPMPVKYTLMPISNVLPPEKRKSFDEAFRFYGAAVGMNKTDMEALTGKRLSLPSILREATQVTFAGKSPGFAACPEHQTLLFGLAMRLNFIEGSEKGLVSVRPCIAGREKCDGGDNTVALGDESRIFALCGNESIGDVEQFVNISAARAEARCPDGFVIAVGFGLTLGRGKTGPEALHIYPCRTNMKECSKSSPADTQSFVWIVCVENSSLGLTAISNRASLGTVGKASNVKGDGVAEVHCEDKAKALLGLRMEIHTRMNRVKDNFKPCSAGKDKCRITGLGVEESMFFRSADRHGLAAWIVCAAEEEDVRGIEGRKRN